MKKAYPYLLLLPVLMLMLLFIVGLADGVLQSFGIFPAAGLTEPTLSYYREVLSQGTLLSSTLYSLYLSLTSALLSTGIGVGVSALLVCTGKREHFLFKVPVTFPHTVAAFLIITLFSQTGFFSRLAGSAGLISAAGKFPLLVQDGLGVGIILAYLLKQAPYVMSVVLLLMRRVYARYGEAARSLGASPRQTFLYVIFSLCRPSISSAFLIILAYSFGSYELPFLLGATLPRTLPVTAYLAFLSPNLSDRPYAMVYNTLMLAFGGLLTILYLLAFRRAAAAGKEI